MIAALRREVAQLIAMLGLSQKEVEQLALEADRQLVEASKAGPSHVLCAAKPVTPRGVARPYPDPAQRHPAAAGILELTHQAAPFIHVSPFLSDQGASLAGPMRNHGVRSRSDSGSSRFSATPPTAAGAAMRPPQPSSSAVSSHIITSTAASASLPSLLFTPATPLAPAPLLSTQLDPPSPSTLAMPPPRRARPRKPRPARINLPLPLASTERKEEQRPCLTPGWLSLRPIRSKLKNPRLPAPSPSKWRFSGLPGIQDLAPGWGNERRVDGGRMECD